MDREDINISPIIYGAIERLRKSFGGTEVKLLSKEMYRTCQDKFVPFGRLGVDIEVMGIKVFLDYVMAEDIACAPYGQDIADDFIKMIKCDKEDKKLRL